MARFVFPSSSHCKLLLLVVCVTASLCFQAPRALAQRGGARFGGGGQFGGGGRLVGGGHVIAPHVGAPHISVPPGRPAIPPFRLSGGTHPAGLGASYFHFRVRPIRPRPVLPIVPFPVIFGAPFFGFWPGYGFDSLWWPSCAPFWGWRFGCTAALYAPYYRYDSGGYISPYVPPYVAPLEYAPPPSYLYGGEEGRQKPQLYLKDATVYNVTDYWLVNGQIHFTTLEEGGAKSVEHVIPLEDVDLQRTIDVNTQMGFRFVLRNAPIEHYLQNRDEGNPPGEKAPPQEN
jgi:hypothetical protein